MRIKILFIIVWCSLTAVHGQPGKDADWKWRATTKESVSDALRNETRVFVSDSNSGVDALDKRTGKIVWQIKTPDIENFYALRLGRSALFLVGGNENQIRAYDAATGKPLWKLPMETDNYYQTAATDDLILNGENHLKAYEATSGKLRWENKSCRRECVPETADNQIFQVGEGKIIAVNAANGANEWIFKRRGEFKIIGTDAASIYFDFSNDDRRSFYSLDRKTGKTNWELAASERDDINYSIIGNRLYGAMYNSSYVFALDAATGKTVWDYAAPEDSDNLRFYQATAHRNRVYFGGSDGFLYVFDAVGGKLLNRFRFAAEAEDENTQISSPLIVGDFGYLLEKNHVHKINLTTGKTLWKFSAYGGIEEIEHEAGTLYFKSLEGSYNALDLSKIERLARTKRILGTASPDANSLSRDIPMIGMSTGGGSFPREKQAISEATRANGKVYFNVTDQAAEQGFLYEFDLATGAKKIVWRNKAVNLASPTIHDGIAYFYDLPLNIYEKSAFSSLVAVNLADGKTVFRETAAAVFSGKPEIVGDSLYAAQIAGDVARYDLRGKFVSKVRSDSWLLKGKFIFGDERRIFFRSSTKELVGFDLEKDSADWTFSQPEKDHLTAFDAASDDGILAAFYHDGVYKLNRQTGKIIWKSEFPDDSFISVKTANGVVFAVSQTYIYRRTWLLAIDEGSGKPLWDASVGTGVTGQVFYEDNICFAGTEDFSCFAQNDGRETFSFAAKNEFAAATENGIALYFIADEKTKTRAALQAVSIKTGRQIWRTNL